MQAVMIAAALYVLMFGVPGASPDEPDFIRQPDEPHTFVTAFQSSKVDAYIQNRPAVLGGLNGNSGNMNERITFKSREEHEDRGVDVEPNCIKFE
jgi:hypothetical protein